VQRFALTEDTHLRLLEEADADELQALIEANRDHLARWLAWAAEQTHADTLDFIRKAREQLDAKDGFQQAVVCDAEMAGVAGFVGVDWVNRSTGIGYWLAEDRQGQGTMTRAVAALVDYAFEVFELNRVEIRAAVENRRSRAIPERLGFRQEAVFRRSQAVGDRHLDMAIYSTLPDEWAARSAGLETAAG
jgi:ribosomal-protein-serine acetyltransferase